MSSAPDNHPASAAETREHTSAGTCSPAAHGAHEAAAQRDAKALVTTLHSALRAVRLYPVENSAVHKAVAELQKAMLRCADDDVCAVRRTGDWVFVNETRVRLGLDNYAAVAYVLGLLRDACIGGVVVRGAVESRAWVVLLALLQTPPLEYPEEARLGQLSDRLVQAGVAAFTLEAPPDDVLVDDAVDARERARQTYVRTLGVTREVMTASRMGRSPSLKRVKRAVQAVVDTIMSDAQSLIGLTTLREFDDYTFVHSVNVCILSVALGRRIGIAKPQLLDLGLAALLHDIGKARLPTELLNKRGALDEAEYALVQSHTWQGVLALFALPVGSGRPWRAMLAAYEHHMRTDLGGYPRTVRPRRLSLFSKIIAVADGFDAATTTRVYRDNPWSPAEVLRGMRDNPRLGFDPVMVKAFINLTGIYPVGTLVVLDTFELGLVHAASADPQALARPIVRLLADAQGNFLAESVLVDLTERAKSGVFRRTIIRTDDPDRWGVRVSDYFA